MNEFDNITTVVDDYDLQILEAGFEKLYKRFARGATKYPKHVLYEALLEGDFWRKYSGLTAEESKKINEILVNAVLEGIYTKPELVAKRIVKTVKIPEKRALLIAKTELAYMANKARELAYKNLTKVQKFVWITERDSKVCEKCKEMAELTKDGVSLDEIKRLLKKVAPKTSRELLAHPGCRCSIYRYYSDKRYVKWWEKQDVPPERRLYIKPEDVPKYSSMGVTVYRGKRGGYYIDKLEASQKGVDIEREEAERRPVIDRRIQKLRDEITRLGLEEDMKEALEKVLSNDDEVAIEGYYEMRGILRKMRKEGAIDWRERNRMYRRLREYFKDKFGFNPSTKKLKEEVKSRKLTVEDVIEDLKNREYEQVGAKLKYLDDLYSEIYERYNVDDGLSSFLKKFRDDFYNNVGTKLVKMWHAGEEPEFDERLLKKTLGEAYLLWKHLDDIEDDEVREKVKEFLDTALEIINIDKEDLENFSNVFIRFDGPFERLKKHVRELSVKNWEKYKDSAHRLYKLLDDIEIGIMFDLYNFGDKSYIYKGYYKAYGDKYLDGLYKAIKKDVLKAHEVLSYEELERFLKDYKKIVERTAKILGVYEQAMNIFDSALEDMKELTEFVRLFSKTKVTDEEVKNFDLPDSIAEVHIEDIELYGHFKDITGRRILSFQRVVEEEYEDELKEWTETLGKVKAYVYGMYKYLKWLGYDDKTAISLARAWEVMRTWTMSNFKKYTGYIEGFVHRIRENDRPLRTKSDIPDKYKELFEVTDDNDIRMYKKFTEKFLTKFYGTDTFKVYRGISFFELLQLLGYFAKGGSPDNVRVNATLVSTSLNDAEASAFARSKETYTVLKFEVPVKYIWGGWWNASPDFVREQEFIIEIPKNDDVKIGVRFNPDNRGFYLYRDMMNFLIQGRKFIDSFAPEERDRVINRLFEGFSKVTWELKNELRMIDKNDDVLINSFDAVVVKYLDFVNSLSDEELKDFRLGISEILNKLEFVLEKFDEKYGDNKPEYVRKCERKIRKFIKIRKRLGAGMG